VVIIKVFNFILLINQIYPGSQEKKLK